MSIHPKKQELKLSILNIATIMNGDTPSKTIQDAIELVQLADQLGYTRYWFAEHHNTSNQVSTAPDLMSMYAAARTERIRIGAGGIMLPNHSSFKVAENFSLLEAAHPGRIDLGIGRASGTDALTAYALRRSQEVVNFPEQLNELLSFFSRNFASDHPFRNIEVISGEPAIPELYMLGSSDGGLNFAVKEGLGLAFASYLSPQMTVPVLRAYKERFKPSVFMSVPRSIVSTIVITAETDDEAKYLAAPLELLWARMYAGTLMQGQPFPSLEEAHSHVYSLAEKEARKENRNRFIIGGIKTVSDQLRNLASETMVDEVMLWEAYTDKVARHKAYKLLADEFKLSSTH